MRKWEDKDGNKRTSAEIVAENVYFGDSKKDDWSGAYEARPYVGGGRLANDTEMETIQAEFPDADDDEGLPF
jgi:single-strand DNA-binding protein